MRIPSQTGLGDFVLREDSSGSLDRWEFVPYPTGRFTLPNDIYMSDTTDKPSGSFDGNGNYIPPKAATAPLLSDADRDDNVPFRMEAHASAWKWGFDYARYQYEAKIASGELMVVKTVKRSELNDHIRTVHDISWDAAGSKWTTHCAGCGAKIIEG